MKKRIKNFSAFSIILLLIACSGNNQYTIQVRVENGPDSLIVFNHWNVSSDTTLLINGESLFSGQLDSFPKMVTVGFPWPSQERTRLVLEPGKILINYSKDDGFTIGGTKNNKILQGLWEELKPYDEAINVKRLNFHHAYNKPDRIKEECELLFDLAQDARARKTAKVAELIRENRNFAGLIIAQPRIITGDVTAEELVFYLDHFKEFSDDRMYKAMKTSYTKVRATTAGYPVENFVLPDTEGSEVALSDFREKWVLLYFWYTGCGWSNRMIPHLVSIYSDWNDKKGFEIVGISIDGPRGYEKWLQQVNDLHAPWTQLLDSLQIVAAEQFGVRGYPTFYLIDKEGRGTIRIAGYREESALRRKLEAYMD